MATVKFPPLANEPFQIFDLPTDIFTRNQKSTIQTSNCENPAHKVTHKLIQRSLSS